MIQKLRRISRRREPSEEAKIRALAVAALMRRNKKISFAGACRQCQIKPKTARLYLGNILVQDHPGGRIRITKSDRRRRNLLIPTAKGQTPVTVIGSKSATTLANYQNAVAEFLRTGRRSKLAPLQGKSIETTNGKMHLLTDPEELKKIAKDTELEFPDFYRTVGGAA